MSNYNLTAIKAMIDYHHWKMLSFTCKFTNLKKTLLYLIIPALEQNRQRGSSFH